MESQPSPEVQVRIQELLDGLESGREIDFDRATQVLYPELKRLASSLLRKEMAGHSLQTTALVHEAFLRLAEGRGTEFRGRLQFLALVSKVMRAVLVDEARSRRAKKRGGDDLRVSLHDIAGDNTSSPVPDMLALDLALKDLAAIHERPGAIVELRFFGGLTTAEIAKVLDISERTVRNDLQVSRKWLARRLEVAASDEGQQRNT